MVGLPGLIGFSKEQSRKGVKESCFCSSSSSRYCTYMYALPVALAADSSPQRSIPAQNPPKKLLVYILGSTFLIYLCIVLSQMQDEAPSQIAFARSSFINIGQKRVRSSHLAYAQDLDTSFFCYQAQAAGERKDLLRPALLYLVSMYLGFGGLILRANWCHQSNVLSFVLQHS